MSGAGAREEIAQWPSSCFVGSIVGVDKHLKGSVYNQQGDLMQGLAGSLSAPLLLPSTVELEKSCQPQAKGLL